MCHKLHFLNKIGSFKLDAHRLLEHFALQGSESYARARRCVEQCSSAEAANAVAAFICASATRSSVLAARLARLRRFPFSGGTCKHWLMANSARHPLVAH